jgi:hypothetical protein
MDSLANSPFAALTVIVAPAILTNASSVLCLGTGNRIARVVDRTRVLASALAELTGQSALAEAYRAHLGRLRVRAHLLLRALRCFYLSIGSFAAAALISVIGSIVAMSSATSGDVVFRTMASLSLVSGTMGVGGLVIGCALMVRETQLAVQFLEHEASLIHEAPRDVTSGIDPF